MPVVRPFKHEADASEFIFVPLLANGLSSQSCEFTSRNAADRRKQRAMLILKPEELAKHMVPRHEAERNSEYPQSDRFKLRLNKDHVA